LVGPASSQVLGRIIGAAVLFVCGLQGHARNCVLGTSGGLCQM
jgi:hypothetical protein